LSGRKNFTCLEEVLEREVSPLGGIRRFFHCKRLNADRVAARRNSFPAQIQHRGMDEGTKSSHGVAIKGDGNPEAERTLSEQLPCPVPEFACLLTYPADCLKMFCRLSRTEKTE
jgi:hypothetical protein